MPSKKKVKSKKDISKFIKDEVKNYKKTGKIGTSKPKSTKKAVKQAAAIAYSKAGKSKKKTSKLKTAKESFEGYVKHLLKESFGVVKKKLVVESDSSEEVQNNPQPEQVEQPVQQPVQREVQSSSGSSVLSKKERLKITKEMQKSKILGGNLKVDSIGKALVEIGNILDSCGFTLDMVTGDMIMGEQGSKLLVFRRKVENPYIEGQEIENSRVSFTWENMENNPSGVVTKKRYEIIAYLS